MEKIEFQASNIKCGGCVSNIEKGLKDLPGISEIKTDIATNIVTIEGENPDKDVIEKKLSELGYPVVN